VIVKEMARDHRFHKFKGGTGPGDPWALSGALAAVPRRFSQVSQFSKVHSFLRHSNSHTAMSFGTVWMIWPVIQGHIRRNCSVCIIGNPAIELTSSPDNYGTVPFDLL